MHNSGEVWCSIDNGFESPCGVSSRYVRELYAMLTATTVSRRVCVESVAPLERTAQFRPGREFRWGVRNKGNMNRDALQENTRESSLLVLGNAARSNLT